MRTISLFVATIASLTLAITGGTPAHAARHHHRVAPAVGPHYMVHATCYHEGSITSDGGGVYVGEVANNFLPLETRIRLDHPVFGKRDFTIKDHIGWGSELDIYGPSEEACMQFGSEQIGFSVIE